MFKDKIGVCLPVWLSLLQKWKRNWIGYIHICEVITDCGAFCWQVTSCVFLLCPQIKLNCFKTNTQGPKIVVEWMNFYVLQNILYVRKSLYVSLKMEWDFSQYGSYRTVASSVSIYFVRLWTGLREMEQFTFFL
jgi:hypothetical protein